MNCHAKEIFKNIQKRKRNFFKKSTLHSEKNSINYKFDVFFFFTVSYWLPGCPRTIVVLLPQLSLDWECSTWWVKHHIVLNFSFFSCPVYGAQRLCLYSGSLGKTLFKDSLLNSQCRHNSHVCCVFFLNIKSYMRELY